MHRNGKRCFRYLAAHIRTVKKILLLSDTHGYVDDTMRRYGAEADEIWHAGDIGDLAVTDALREVAPLKAVFGNIDDDRARREFPLHQRFLCEAVDVWITHIGGYPGHYNPTIRSELHLNPPRLFVCGHSHILRVMNDPKLGLLHMNPGAIGKHGFHAVRTMLRFTIEGADIRQLEVIEMEKRG